MSHRIDRSLQVVWLTDRVNKTISGRTVWLCLLAEAVSYAVKTRWLELTAN